MPKSIRPFVDPETGEWSVNPWSHDVAVKKKQPQYRDKLGCVRCYRTPTDRYTRSHVCVRCVGDDLTRIMRGDSPLVLNRYPEDKFVRRRPVVMPAADPYQANGEMARMGIDTTVVPEPRISPFDYGVPQPCAWGPHFMRLDDDGNCLHCIRERPTARQQIAGWNYRGITREAARLQELTVYQGTPCVNGHDGWRYVNSDRCFHCEENTREPNRELRPKHSRSARQFAEDIRITREQALESGMPLFFSGSCIKGHIGWRRLKGGACYTCVHAESTGRLRLTAAQQIAQGLKISAKEARNLKHPLYFSQDVWYWSDDRSEYLMPPAAMDEPTAKVFGFKVWCDAGVWREIR